MALIVTKRLADDLDHTLDAETSVDFSVNGTAYVLDLAKSNEKKFLDMLAPWIEVARKSGKAPKVKGAPRVRSNSNPAPGIDPEQKKVVEAWVEETEAETVRQLARKGGVAVSDRGRISLEGKVAAYNQAHPTKRTAKSDHDVVFSAGV